MTRRLSISALAAGLVTFAIFFTMQSLVNRSSRGLADADRLIGINFIRLARDESVKRREREKPKKLERTKPPPPTAPSVQKGPDPTAMAMKVDIPAFTASLAGSGGQGGPYFGGAADTDVVPLVRVNAQYPSRAQARGIEGWVHVRFTVTPLGTTDQVEVVDADPRGFFEAAAKNAVKKYRYKPKFEGGKAVERPGVEVVLSFKLER